MLLIYWALFENFRLKTALYWWNSGLSDQAAWRKARTQTRKQFEELERATDFKKQIEKFPRLPDNY